MENPIPFAIMGKHTAILPEVESGTAGCPEPQMTENPFTDITPDDYFYQAALWAYETGITVGTGEGKFSPYDICLNAHALTYIGRAFTGNKIQGGTEWYDAAMLWAEDKGMPQKLGYEIAPLAPCTRGDAITYLYYGI